MLTDKDAQKVAADKTHTLTEEEEDAQNIVIGPFETATPDHPVYKSVVAARKGTPTKESISKAVKNDEPESGHRSR